MQLAAILRDMMNQHPLLIVFDILALMTAAGCFVVLVREAVLFRGYRSLKRITKSLRATLRGSIFRDGADLVISGFYRGVPAVVRFSFAENTPEVNIWMKVTSALNLFISHRSSKSAEGRMRIPTKDARFDERFSIRSDNPNDALALLTDDRAFEELKKLCCSPGTSIALSRESLELSELTIPHPNTLKHLLAHMNSLAEMATRVGALSILTKSRTKIYVPDRYLVARAALVVLLLAGGLELYSAVRRYSREQAPQVETGASPVVSAISPEDQLLIPGVDAWRLATPDDFDPETVTWMREQGKNATGRLVGSFSGAGQPSGTGYVLVPAQAGQKKSWRVVMLTQGHSVLDGAYAGVLAAVLVPKANIENANWQPSDKAVASPPDGDGIMVIRREGDATTATICYMSNGRLQSRMPADYLGVALR
jgi:hypothetical protein